MLLRILALVSLVFCIQATPVTAQTQQETDRSATGGAQTLEDIMRRQAGETIDDRFRSENLGGEAIGAPGLGPRGSSSDADIWRALRYNAADVTTSTRDVNGKVLVQDGGMAWFKFREGPLATYGGWLLLGTLIALIIFYVLRGKIKLDAAPTGRTVTRFVSIERFAHWLLAGSFILLGLTGLLTLFGRMFIAPMLGKEVNATLLLISKFIHNNVAWAFILGLIMVFVMWVRHNLPDRTDIKWFAQAGGIIGNKHPPAKKFNGGQKIIFWAVIVLGGSISVSGLSLLFPFELPLFAKTFGILNQLGLTGLVGLDPLPEVLSPQQEMQFAQAWHAIVAFVLMAIIIAHIYIGSVGMEGAYDAMGTGEVDEAWAHQHHSIWLDELKQSGGSTEAAKTPAE